MIDFVERVKLAIARDLDKNTSLRELSRGLNCSPFQLCRSFRRATGQTITSYRHGLRLRVALERLRHRGTDITDLALELGYCSHSHFTNVFRRHLGITPSQYRQTP
jgi:AraC-like DNA-binding protein